MSYEKNQSQYSTTPPEPVDQVRAAFVEQLV